MLLNAKLENGSTYCAFFHNFIKIKKVLIEKKIIEITSKNQKKFIYIVYGKVWLVYEM